MEVWGGVLCHIQWTAATAIEIVGHLGCARGPLSRNPKIYEGSTTTPREMLRPGRRPEPSDPCLIPGAKASASSPCRPDEYHEGAR